MSTPLLRTKLYIIPVRTELVSRSRLIERLDHFLDWYETREETQKGKPKIDLVHKEFVKV